jgi:SPP1 gp7 family putative phage head morphogenesis protein
VPLTRSAFDDLLDAYRGRAFTVAKQETVNAVQVVHDLVGQTLKEGGTLAEFLKGLQVAADAGGITAINPYHARTVFDTNLQTAYNAGRWEMYHAPEVVEAFPMYEYDSVIDGVTTPFCRKMNLYRAPADAPIWDTIWPPNHFNCRATVTAISREEITRDRVRPTARPPEEPPPGWAGNPAQAIRTAGLRDAEAAREMG